MEVRDCDLPLGDEPSEVCAVTLSARLGLTRQWLHAKKLGFRHPGSGEYVQFETRYPDDLQRALEVLRAD